MSTNGLYKKEIIIFIYCIGMNTYFTRICIHTGVCGVSIIKIIDLANKKHGFIDALWYFMWNFKTMHVRCSFSI